MAKICAIRHSILVVKLKFPQYAQLLNTIKYIYIIVVKRHSRNFAKLGFETLGRMRIYMVQTHIMKATIYVVYEYKVVAEVVNVFSYIFLRPH